MVTDSQSERAGRAAPVEVVNAAGRAPIILVCEHASNRIPEEYGNLGLTPDILLSHIAWDPGARAVALRMSQVLDAPLVAGTMSRLIFDCNRPPEAPDAIPTISEIYAIPGNRDMTPADRARRIATIHDPFRDALAQQIASRPGALVVTIHSFTPVFHGKTRETELGILHDTDRRLADAMLARSHRIGLKTGRNSPYGPQDGVTHTLRAHAIPQGRLNVMLEIRSDLIATAASQAEMGEKLADLLTDSLADFAIHREAAR